MFRVTFCIGFNSRTLGRVRQNSPYLCSVRGAVSIHAPWEGCDRSCEPSRRSSSRFQFTHPGKGATACYPPVFNYVPSFNSRTLGRVRLDPTSTTGKDKDVSIHAPWEGCDHIASIIFRANIRFQFTHPGKGATQDEQHRGNDILFQFTHPGKGATAEGIKSLFFRYSFNSRTLGRVRHSANSNDNDNNGFNSRTLGRVRLGRRNEADIASTVSIHAPWEGCDVSTLDLSRTLGHVSIHAPWEGCDPILDLLL